MSIKINLNTVSPEVLQQTKNYKIECDSDGCYLVLPDEADEETSVILEDTSSEVKKNEVKDEEKTTETTKTSTTEQKTSCENLKTDIIKLSDESSLDDLRNQKGTVFVVVGGTACGRCRSFEKVLGNINDNINDKATIAQLTLPSNYNKTDYAIYETLKAESNEKGGSHGYPIIIKMVDGKATEFYDYSDYSGIYTKTDKMTAWLEGKIEGTKTVSTEAQKENECADGSCETKIEEESTKETQTTQEEQKASSLSELTSENEEAAITDFASQVKGAKSIGALKNLLFETAALNINTQLKVMDAINGIAFSDDLQSAKAKVINALK